MPDADVILHSFLNCATLLRDSDCLDGAIDEPRVELRRLPFLVRHAPASAEMLAQLCRQGKGRLREGSHEGSN